MAGSTELAARARAGPSPAAPAERRGGRLPMLATVMGFSLLAMACVVAGYLAWRNVRTSDALGRALEVHRAARGVQEVLLAAEAGQRGFLISGEEALLAPYRAAQTELPGLLDRLQLLAATDAGRLAAVRDLAVLARTKMTYLAGTVALAENGEAVAARVRTGEGLRLSRATSAATAALMARTDADVAHATAAHRRLSLLLVLSIVLCLACAGTLAAVLLRDMGRQVRRLAAREAVLHQLSATLDERVAQRTRALTETNLRFEVALEASGVTVATQDRDLVFTWISKGWMGRSAEEIVGLTDEALNPDATMVAVAALKRAVLETGEAARREMRVVHRHGECWIDMSVQPMAGDDGTVEGVITGAIDVTAYKEQQARIRLLMREVTHRSLNLLTVIEAIMRQTARNTTSLEDFEQRFSARLQSLAGSHDLLVQEDWAGASLRALVRSQLGHFSDIADAQVEMAGPPLHLAPDAAQHIGMALHELATNAARYGALTVPDGKVSISWELVMGADGRAACQLVWE